ncbi:flagellar basal-body rod protein FlgF [Pseudidiomarina planktonica]|uniref:Flagellar basal-body rod protein FlgF n=1 Tax=Pseudidiomarina planktonica TaxID=1323738 RepID=A0A1Y6EM81_9GAMM|nr:flagellar basal body rod protein FlgF [Pseudidiomarina planktonica]RUO65883.1 flagellar basal body rod protein FlgF [Pseudidiomarina planktonica]SMQ62070.1 flagellar basal-body rod protein FlgF [Pseudidiomarina planktonica]
MDRMLYIAMSGAKENMNGIALRANNLANTNSVGFKSDLQQARSMQAYGEGMPTRVFSLTESPGQNYAGGALMTTERNLDVAVNGDGWLAVADDEGNEAYTRNGSLQMTAEGMLQTSSGQPLLGDGGPIFLPIPVEKVEIGSDGSIMVRPQGAPAEAMEVVDRMKLVNPPNGEIERGKDGLYRRKDGFDAILAAEVRIEAGALEKSNVNPIEEMTQMISLQRQFDMNVKMMKTADENGQRSETLMRVS